MTTNVDIKSEYKPEGLEGQGFFATSLDKAVGLARANSLWPCPSPPLVAVSSSWQPWHRTTTFHALEWSA